MISPKTIGRLSLYRRVLKAKREEGAEHVFSHELAALAACTPAQVRRDVMNMGFSGSPARGYDVERLIDTIGEFLGGSEGEAVALVGVGNLGRAILSYFSNRNPKYTLVAAFDSDPDKVNRVIHGCRCHPLEEMERVIREKAIRVAMIAVPASEAQDIATALCAAGVRGLVNFAPAGLWTPDGVYVEDVDVTMALERVAYYARGRVEEKV